MPEDVLTATNTPYWRVINPILQTALQSVDPYQCVLRNVNLEENTLKIGSTNYQKADFDNIYLIGTGKAIIPMAQAVLERLEDLVNGGLLIGKHADDPFRQKLAPKIAYLLGGHPVPSALSLESTHKLVNFLNKLTKRDLVICLISGGGSALMSLPYDPITLDDLQETTRQLLFSGATINEVNIIRKHLDQIKGGGLARLAEPATLATLVLSDVIGDALDAIASGPTVADHSTFQDAMQIIKRYHMEGSLPRAVAEGIREGMQGKIQETVKDGDACLARTATTVIGSLRIAAEAAREKAVERGFQTILLDIALQGEAREKGAELAAILRSYRGEEVSKRQSLCWIAGGETTVTVHGSGKGGRNQETALSAAIRLDGLEKCLFVSLATDGEDGPTDAAGAVVDGGTLEKGRQAGLDAADFLIRNDAYHFLERTGSLIKTGPTGTNVNDLVLMFSFA